MKNEKKKKKKLGMKNAFETDCFLIFYWRKVQKVHSG